AYGLTLNDLPEAIERNNA
ncbi:hypothetical protein AAGT13_15460, partial [Azotobacter salinestris]